MIIGLKNWRNDMDNNTPVYDFEEAINFISERCDAKEIIEKIS